MIKFSEHKSFSSFLLLVSFIWILLFIVNIFYSKFDLHILLNSHHNFFLDQFFKTVTHLGDGWFAVILAVSMFYFKDKNQGVLILATFLFSALFAQILKNFVFEDFMRPFYYINAGTLDTSLVDGVKMHKNNSFPSGHTTTIFALCSMLTFFFKSFKAGFLLCLIAVITAYSRIYLSQHFLQDTLAGALLGVSSSLVVYIVLNKKLKIWINNSIEK
jgi:membrane-associated phospholipid phosphatase